MTYNHLNYKIRSFKINFFISFLVLFLICISDLFSNNTDYKEIVIKLKKTQGFSKSFNSDNRVYDFFKDNENKYKFVSYKKVFNNAPNSNIKSYKTNSNKNFNKEKLENIYSIRVSTEVNIESLIRDIKQNPIVEWVEPKYKKKLYTFPNDEKFDNQWYLSSDIYKDINILKLWNLFDFNKYDPITVAVMDTGIFPNHPDIKNSLWINEKEVPGNEIDDDNNGFIDDVNGVNFGIVYDNNNNPISHGQHVAGIIGAKGNNSIGIAGINWNCKIMTLNVFYDSDFDIEEAIEYAVDNGAKVINMSLGLIDHDENIDIAEPQVIKEAIEYAVDNGVICVVAAGNEYNNSIISYPARFSNCLAVAATDKYDKKCDFSNCSKDVDISAPGYDIYSLYLDNDYISYNGTSMACPVVAGVVSLLLSIDKNLNLAEIKDIFQKSAVKIDDINPQYQGKLGAGRVDAFGAIKELLTSKIKIKNLNNYDINFYRILTNNEVYCSFNTIWDIENSYNIPLSYKIKLSTDTNLNSLDDDTEIIKSNSKIWKQNDFPIKLLDNATYYVYLQGINEDFDFKTEIYKSSPLYIKYPVNGKFDKEEIIEGKAFYYDEYPLNVEVCIPKNTFQEDYSINFVQQTDYDSNFVYNFYIKYANDALDEKLKKGAEKFQRTIFLEFLNDNQDEQRKTLIDCNNSIEIRVKGIDSNGDNIADNGIFNVDDNICVEDLEIYFQNSSRNWEKIDNYRYDKTSDTFIFQLEKLYNYGNIFAFFTDEKGLDPKVDQIQKNENIEISVPKNTFEEKYIIDFSVLKENNEKIVNKDKIKSFNKFFDIKILTQKNHERLFSYNNYVTIRIDDLDNDNDGKIDGTNLELKDIEVYVLDEEKNEWILVNSTFQNDTFTEQTNVLRFYLNLSKSIYGIFLKSYYEENKIVTFDDDDNIEIFVPKKTFQENFYIKKQDLDINYPIINITNNKLDDLYKNGINSFSKFFNLTAYAQDGIQIKNFDNFLNIKIKNLDKNLDGFVDGTDIGMDDLEVYYLYEDEEKKEWQKVNTYELDKNNMILTFKTDHFSIFGIFAKKGFHNIDINDVICYPNPFKIYEHKNLIFGNFPDLIENLDISIYDLSGKLLKKLDKNNLTKNIKGRYEIIWDGKSDKNYQLASGIYFAKMKLNKRAKIFKIAILV